MKKEASVWRITGLNAHSISSLAHNGRGRRNASAKSSCAESTSKTFAEG